MLTSITYVSRPNLPPESPAIQDLWAQALQNNEKMEITGAIYFDGQCFAHFLEGDETPLYQLFEKIKQDDRHSDILVLSQVDLASRMFSNYSLKLIDGSRSKALRRRFDYDELRQLDVSSASKIPFRLRRL